MSITSDAGDAEYGPDMQALVAEREDARRWAVRLEGELAAAQERARSDLEREHARWRAADARAVAAEGECDAALGRLATMSGEAAAYRHQRRQARAERDETLNQLSAAHDERGAYRRQRDEARAERDEVVNALAYLLAGVDELTLGDPTHDELPATVALPALVARQLVERYRPAPATIESHGTPK